MKKSLAIIAASAALVLCMGALVGCSSSSSSSASASASASIPNPMVEVADQAAMEQETDTKVFLLTSFKDPKFFVYTLSDGKMAEVQFANGAYNSAPAAVRAMKTDEADLDISGINGTPAVAEDTPLGGDVKAILRIMDDKKTAVSTFYNPATKTVYSLSFTNEKEAEAASLKASIRLMTLNFYQGLK